MGDLDTSGLIPAALPLLLVAFPVVGFFAKDWLTLLFPFLGWPLFFVGWDRNWWIGGLADEWLQAAAVLTAIGVGTTAIAVGTGKLLAPPFAPRLDEPPRD